MSALDTAYQRLREQGHRLTSARKRILHILSNTSGPLSAQEVRALCPASSRPDKVTVYRELAFLAAQGLASLVTLDDGVRRYVFAAGDSHKHHLVCTECRAIQDIEMDHDDLEQLERQISKQNKFAVQSHSLEFYGLCSQCV